MWKSLSLTRKSDLKGQPLGQSPSWEEALSFHSEAASLGWELGGRKTFLTTSHLVCWFPVFR